MNELDYEQYHQKGGTYVIPVEVFDELLEENQELKNQQKEFINYLEKKISAYAKAKPFFVEHIHGSYNLMELELNMLKEILVNYKEIIGDNK